MMKGASKKIIGVNGKENKTDQYGSTRISGAEPRVEHVGPSAPDGGAGRLGVGVWPRAQFCSIVGACDFLRDQIAMVLSGHLINLY